MKEIRDFIEKQEAKDLLKTAQDFMVKLRSYLKKWIEKREE